MSIYEAFTLLGGVGLFLYGMTIMSSGLRNACGDNLRLILEKATRSKVTAVLAGIAVTVLVQSSSATDVMVIGFVSSGLMTVAQAIGVSRQTIGLIESGEFNPSIRLCIAICKALHTTLNDLFWEESEHGENAL